MCYMYNIQQSEKPVYLYALQNYTNKYFVITKHVLLLVGILGYLVSRFMPQSIIIQCNYSLCKYREG